MVVAVLWYVMVNWAVTCTLPDVVSLRIPCGKVQIKWYSFEGVQQTKTKQTKKNLTFSQKNAGTVNSDPEEHACPVSILFSTPHDPPLIVRRVEATIEPAQCLEPAYAYKVT